MVGPQNWPWSALGLDGQADAKTVRRAYAKMLKSIDQSNDIAGFSALRQAYDFALRMAGTPDHAGPKTEVVRLADDTVIAIRNETGQDLAPETLAELAEALQDMDREAAPAPGERTDPDPKPVAEPDASPQPEPADPQSDALETPPDPTPSEAKWHRFGQLRHDLTLHTPWAPASTYIMTLLRDPLAQDPDIGPIIRRMIRDKILDQVSSNQGNWPMSLGRDEVRALDQAYHWLTDYRAAQADFGQRFDILHMMAGAGEAGRLVNPEAQAALRRRGRINRRGRHIVPVLSYIAISCFIGLMLLTLFVLPFRPMMKGDIGVVAFIAMLAAIPITWILRERIRVYLVALTLPIFDRLDEHRQKLRRFALAPGLRTHVMIGWIVVLVATTRFIEPGGDPSARWAAGTVLILGLIHEFIQVWLNSEDR